jgi:S-adenosylmethionine-diacylglycerol 3-amino-3-carboxypropyl transferase
MSGDPRTAAPTLHVASVLAAGELRYSTVWEDHLLLERGLAPKADDDLLVIASAGDNVLNLLLLEPRRIVAIDVNPGQLALVELKLAALSVLDHRAFLQLLGLIPQEPNARIALYERVRARLSNPSRSWWDDHTAIIASGVSEAGRLDRYIAGFRELNLDRDDVDVLLSSQTLAEQRANAKRIFSTDFHRAFTHYFSAEYLGGRARDPSQMQYVSDEFDVTAHLLSRLIWACTEMPLRGNFYVERFFRGVETAVPYLHPDAYLLLRRLASRVELVNAEIADYLASCPARSLSHAALSDVFEYLSNETTAVIADDLGRVIRTGGRVAYWNLFVPRTTSATSTQLQLLDSLSNELWSCDRAWFYRAFRVEEVVT